MPNTVMYWNRYRYQGVGLVYYSWYITLGIYNYTFISIYNTYYMVTCYSFDGCTNIVMPMYNNDCELKYKSVIE